VLRFLINYNLDTRNKTEFEENSKKYNELNDKINNNKKLEVYKGYWTETPRNLYGDDF